MPLISDIIAAIEAEAPLILQESWDNSGLQVGHADRECTGVLLALDPSEEVVEEAKAGGCNCNLSWGVSFLVLSIWSSVGLLCWDGSTVSHLLVVPFSLLGALHAVAEVGVLRNEVLAYRA